MSKQTSWQQRFWNRFYAIPVVTQWWARRRIDETAALVETNGIPFARLRKPLATARCALITTAGVHLRTQPPFDMENPDGDATYRIIAADASAAEMTITHQYYDHRDADRDLNVVFPLAQLRTLAALGVIGALGPRHFGFMGHVDGSLLPTLTEQSARAVAAKLRADQVDFALLTPA